MSVLCLRVTWTEKNMEIPVLSSKLPPILTTISQDNCLKCGEMKGRRSKVNWMFDAQQTDFTGILRKYEGEIGLELQIKHSSCSQLKHWSDPNTYSETQENVLIYWRRRRRNAISDDFMQYIT